MVPVLSSAAHMPGLNCRGSLRHACLPPRTCSPQADGEWLVDPVGAEPQGLEERGVLDVKPETKEALDAGRLRHLVFFDFMFSPTRVHDGEGAIEWEGNEWEGVGGLLTPRDGQPPWSMTYFSSAESSTGHLIASLPLNKAVSEVVTKGYYRGRPMTLLLCSLDEAGEIIERFGILPYSIVECAIKGQRVTFKALDQTFASPKDLDANHKDNVEAVRSRFKWDVADTMASSALGWAINAATVNVLGILLDVTLFLLPGRRRALMQRWAGSALAGRAATTLGGRTGGVKVRHELFANRFNERSDLAKVLSCLVDVGILQSAVVRFNPRALEAVQHRAHRWRQASFFDHMQMEKTSYALVTFRRIVAQRLQRRPRGVERGAVETAIGVFQESVLQQRPRRSQALVGLLQVRLRSAHPPTTTRSHPARRFGRTAACGYCPEPQAIPARSPRALPQSRTRLEPSTSACAFRDRPSCGSLPQAAP